MRNLYDVIVVGGGIVGLSTAMILLQRRPGSGVLVLEKEARLASHQSGRNSGVIHAGVYYAPGSLKARLCVAGARATREFCDEHGLPYRDTGKLVVATDEAELSRMEALHERATANGLTLERLDAAELRRREPRVRGVGALFSPTTGIVDYRQVSAALAGEIERLGGEIRTGVTVTGIDESCDAVRVMVAREGEPDEPMSARRLVSCAGIQADRLARLAGLKPHVRTVPFRGEYYRLPEARADLVGTLIYPVPDPELPFLGVHLTLMMDGSVTVGPNAVQGWAKEGYGRFALDLRDAAEVLTYPGWWRFVRRHLRSGLDEQLSSWSKAAYLARVRRYCPSVAAADLTSMQVGIRAQAIRADGSPVEDFLVLTTGRTLHVLNAPSPAATSALPIGGLIADRLAELS